MRSRRRGRRRLCGGFGRRASRQLQSLCRHPKSLCLHHTANHLLVIIGLVMARLTALPQAIIPLGIKQTVFVETCLLETVIHVGGEDKIILIFHQLQQLLIHRLGRIAVAVEENKSAPVGPVFFQGLKRIKSAGVHVMKAVFRFEVRKIALEAFSVIGESRRCGKASSRSDDHRLRLLQSLLQFPRFGSHVSQHSITPRSF